MGNFIVINPRQKIPKKVFPIDADPSLKYEVYVFSKKNNVTFEDVLKIYRHSFSKKDYLGAMSLIYFKYYNEFYDFLITISNDKSLIKKYKNATKKFYMHYLKRWIDFIGRSDDTMFPQNNVLKKMNALIIQKFNF